MGKFWLPGDTPPKEWPPDPEPDPNRTLLYVHPKGLKLKVSDRIVWVCGDMIPSSRGEYIVHHDGLVQWESPFENETIDQETRQRILELAVQELRNAGWWHAKLG